MDDFWLIYEGAFAHLASAFEAAPAATAEELAQAEAKVAADTSAQMSVVNGVATIPVQGVLLNARNPILAMFGVPHSSLVEIAAATAKADADPNVKRIEYAIDSPGGLANNQLLDAAKAIAAASKPTQANVGDMAASAAFWLAAQTDEIILAGRASKVGSVGIVAEARVNSRTVTIASTDAPRKRPDLSTPEGQADARVFLDQMHALFVEALVSGRGVSAEHVKENFGKGGLVLAEQAVAAGMADRIGPPSPSAAPRAILGGMDRDKLKAEFPELFAAIKAEGEAEAKAAEKARIDAHLELGKQAKAMDVAVKFIAEGTAVNAPEVTAAYLGAAVAGIKQGERQEEDPGAVSGVAPASGDPQAAVADLMSAELH